MINYKIIVAGSYSIAIAAVIGLIRFPKLNKAYRPFVFITTASLANEIISHILILHKKSNAVALNIFGFFDAILWLWQFKRWNRYHKYHALCNVAAIVLMLVWMLENIVLRKLFSFGSIYAITLSFSLVIFSIVELTRLAAENDKLIGTTKFLICCGAILFYTYRILVECIYAPGFSDNEIFLGNVFTILSLINFIVNLLFALAVLCIPGKQKFSLPFY
jgi:hypothetical protein